MNVIKSNYQGLIGTNNFNGDEVVSYNVTNSNDISSNTIHAHQIYIDGALLSQTGQTGPAGKSISLAVGTVTSLPYGSTPAITMTNYYDISSNTTYYTQNYQLVTGPTGLTGKNISLTVGSVTSLPYGSTPAITMTNSYDAVSNTTNYTQNYQLVTGPTGLSGKNISLAVGSVTSVPYGSTPAITMTSSYDAVSNTTNYTQNYQLVTGPTGQTGRSFSLAVGTVTTVPYGGTPAVNLTSYYDASSNTTNYTQNYTLVTGPQGPQGSSDNALSVVSGIVGGMTVIAAGYAAWYSNFLDLFGLGNLFGNSARNPTPSEVFQAQINALDNAVASLQTRVTNEENKSRIYDNDLFYIITSQPTTTTKFVGCDFYLTQNGSSAHFYNGNLALDNNLYGTVVQASNNVTTPQLNSTNITNTGTVSTSNLTVGGSTTTNSLQVTGYNTTVFNGNILCNGSITCIGNLYALSNETVSQDLTVNGLTTTARLAVLQDQVNGILNEEIEMNAFYNAAIAGFGSIY